eukprot:5604963-Ditylum_brightwellii.AAC.1
MQLFIPDPHCHITANTVNDVLAADLDWDVSLSSHDNWAFKAWEETFVVPGIQDIFHPMAFAMPLNASDTPKWHQTMNGLDSRLGPRKSVAIRAFFLL